MRVAIGLTCAVFLSGCMTLDSQSARSMGSAGLCHLYFGSPVASGDARATAASELRSRGHLDRCVSELRANAAMSAEQYRAQQAAAMSNMVNGRGALPAPVAQPMPSARPQGWWTGSSRPGISSITNEVGVFCDYALNGAAFTRFVASGSCPISAAP